MENGLAEVKGMLPETLPEYIMKENKLELGRYVSTNRKKSVDMFP